MVHAQMEPSRDDFFARGYWEAKGPDKDLEKEIAEKIKKGYPITNIIFENTKRAVLCQNKKHMMWSSRT